MIEDEFWSREADQKQKDRPTEQSPSPDLSYPKKEDKKPRRYPAWEDDYEPPVKVKDPEPKAPEVKKPPVEEEKTEMERAVENFEAKLRKIREEARKREEEEQRRRERERRKREEEKKRRRGRCPFCGGPPHGRGEMGGD